jgi:hypothetical protein
LRDTQAATPRRVAPARPCSCELDVRHASE